MGKAAPHRNVLQVDEGAVAVDNGVHLGRRNDLEVGRVVVEPRRPVVDLDAAHDRIVGLRGVDGTRHQILQILCEIKDP